jgi:hypothetical protein
MSIEVSQEVETRLSDEARRQGVSLDVLLERLVDGLGTQVSDPATAIPELPKLHLGHMGTLRRREIYDDVG